MPHQSLYRSIFDHPLSDENAMVELQRVSKEFSYFSLAQFFLLSQTPAEHTDSDKISALTALHFNNPYLLNQQLKKEIKNKSLVVDGNETTIISEDHAEISTGKISNLTEPVALDFEDDQHPEKSERKPEEITEQVSQEIKNVEPGQSVSLNGSEEIVEEKNEQAAIPEQKTELLFEPLYTTDYFASQGIKLSEEVQPTDKLGKQLKSFTEWLKTMKKVHDTKLPEGNEQLDASVNKLAEKSNKDEEVITEAMAEAYIIQGKPEKAKDIYLKLSLLNPSKNAYFAAKIGQIAW